LVAQFVADLLCVLACCRPVPFDIVSFSKKFVAANSLQQQYYAVVTWAIPRDKYSRISSLQNWQMMINTSSAGGLLIASA
jgi:hypothetical protein